MSRGLRPNSVRGKIRAQFPDVTDERFKRARSAVWNAKLPLTADNIAAELERPERLTIADRVREILPTSYERAYEVLSDISRLSIYCAIRSMMGRGRIVRLDTGMLVSGETPTGPVKQAHRVTRGPGPERGEDRHTEPVKATLWSASPEQSPRVTCPERVTVGLSTCLNDYTAAASGHRSGPVECARCSVGRRRRMELAWGATC